MTLVVPRATLCDKLHSLLGQVASINNFQIKILHGLLGKKLAFYNATATAETSLLQKAFCPSTQTHSFLSVFNSPTPQPAFSFLLAVLQTCLAEAKVAKVLAREAESVTGRFFVTTSRVSLSRPSGDWLAEEVSSVYQALSTKRPVVFSRLDI